MNLLGAFNINGSFENGLAGAVTDAAWAQNAGGELASFGQALEAALKQAEGTSATFGSLAQKGLAAAGAFASAASQSLAPAAPQVFGSSVAQNLNFEEAQSGLEFLEAALPNTYKKQLGLEVLSRPGAAPSSLKLGAELMDCATGGQALKGVLASLGGERSVLKLDKEALPELTALLEESGLEQSDISDLIGDLMASDMDIDQLFYQLEKYDLSGSAGGGLKATATGLSSMAQFFKSLGASPETVSRLTSSFELGQSVTAEALQQIVGDDPQLSTNISQGDMESLRTFLRSMGASQQDLRSLANLFQQNGGQMSLNELFGFIENMRSAPAEALTDKQLERVKNILNKISREQELAKTPVFDETLTKLQMLGDQEIDGEFMKMSPALQALRGGLTAQSLNNSFGGYSGQNGHNSQEEQAQEHYRQVLHATNSESTPTAAIDTVETAQSYGGQETLARQISQKIIYSHRRGLHRLKMNLNPANLGQVDIELKVEGERLTAHLRLENRDSFQAVAEDIESLKQALTDSGIELANITVALDDSSSGATEFAQLSSLNKAAAQPARDDKPAGHEGELHRVI